MSRAENFWSRRRAGVEAEAAADDAALEAKALAAEHAVLEEKTDDEILAELDLPDPDSLEMGDDFSAFMSKVVPDRIRRRALRVLWRSNPTLANVDMLVDYGEDFTDKALVVENMQTAYQVGKGMLKHVEEMARQAAERERSEEDVSEDLPEDDVLADEQPETSEGVMAAVDEGTDTEDVPAYDAMPDADADAYIPPAPRRMKFRTEETA